MDLHFLGCGAAFNPDLGNTAAYWAEGDQLLLLDCGETVFSRLLSRGALQKKKQVYAAVSHLHSDHCGSLGSLALYCKFVLDAQFTLLVPDDAAYVQALRALMGMYGVGPEDYALRPHGALDFSAIFSRRYVPTSHAPGMPCFSFVLETPEGGVFYSADTNTAAQLLDFLQSHGRVHRIYMEAALEDAPDSVHLSLKRLTEALPPALYPVTRLMHLNGDACRAAGEALGLRAARPD